MGGLPRAAAGRAVRRLPGVRTLLEQRDAARRQRDEVRAQRDAARQRHAEATARLAQVERRAATADQELRRVAEALAEAERRLAAAVPYERPSFAASLARVQRLRELTAHEHGARHPIWEVNPKTAGRELAASVGVEVPALVAGPAGPDELELDLTRPIVVKPTGGSTSRGVMPLVPRGDGGAWSVFGGEELDEEGVRTRMREAAADPRVSDEFLVEELVPSDRPGRVLPDDWKCYAFGGRVELLMQRDPHDSADGQAFRFKWYDREGRDLGAARPGRHDPSLPPAADHAAIVAAAEKVAAVVPGPFVRIDLFVAGERVVFGELTPHPGGNQRFEGELDERLGAAWERAEAALLVRTYDTSFPG